MEYMAKNIPLWQITTWDKNFNNVDKEWQPKTIKYKYLLSDELDSLRVDDGDIRILYTGKDVGYTTEELAGDNISEGELFRFHGVVFLLLSIIRASLLLGITELQRAMIQANLPINIFIIICKETLVK